MNKVNASAIVNYIKEFGGSVSRAARALNITLSPRIRKAISAIDPEIQRYRYAFRRHGLWLTLPTPTVASRNEQKVSCVCLGCNTLHDVNLINLQAGRTKGCKRCMSASKPRQQVICESTGESYASIRAFAKSKGILDSYQQIRHKLQSANTFTHKEQEFVLK